MKRYTLEDMQQLARKRGGKCISNEYQGMNHHLNWRCGNGHEWAAIPSSIKAGHWCPRCYGNNPFTITDLSKIAASRGGQVLSEKMDNRRSMLRWRCAEGHEWHTSAQNVMAGHWCPVCGKSQPLSLETAMEAAITNGGRCLSESYVNARASLLWECKFGHRWRTSLYKIRSGQWCRICRTKQTAAKLQLTLDEVQKRARQKGGVCLATEYGGTAGTVLQFECVHQHRWWASPNTIKRSWCPYCAGKIVSLDDIQCIARERGGRCMSERYTNDTTKLSWQCRYGHKWDATPGSVKQGTWCPECSSGLGERLCRAFFESLFQADFSRAYPAWMRLGGRSKLHLDGYNKELGIAFEHHGRYHFGVEGRYSKDATALARRQQLDNLKASLCRTHEVRLIIVPEIPTMLPVAKVREFVLARCAEAGIIVPHPNATTNLMRAYAPDWWDYYNEMAVTRGGRLLSKHYMGAGTKHQWSCEEGHIWESVPNSVQQGTWCPFCRGIRITDETKVTRLTELAEVAHARGGTCLATEYVSCNTKVYWQCGLGHGWQATPRNVMVNGSWCPYCWQARRGLRKGQRS
jgi:hypothetical protein